MTGARAGKRDDHFQKSRGMDATCSDALVGKNRDIGVLVCEGNVVAKFLGTFLCMEQLHVKCS